MQKGIATLTVGDNIPDFKLAKIFNGKYQSAMLSGFRNQLLIFDFDNTGCKLRRSIFAYGQPGKDVRW